jgi:hypothetical protein
MDQQSIASHLSLKSLYTIEIGNDLVALLQGKAKSYSILTYYLHKPSFWHPKTPQSSESSAPILNESEEAILLAVSETPFASVRQLARRTHRHHWASTTPSHTSLGSPFNISVMSHIFCRKPTRIPVHIFHLNPSRCSSSRKTGRGMT